MKPAITSANWLHRPMLDPDRPRPHVESFFIKANDPKHDRALWVRMTLLCDGRETVGETWAVFFDRDRGRILAAKERWPANRIHVDPERAGLGVGPCNVDEGSSYGLVRGSGFSLAWRLALHDELPPYCALPFAGMYSSGLVSFKICTPHPSAELSGALEIWRGESRADCEVVDLSGWRGMLGHNWGKRHSPSYAWTHCNAFDEAPTGTFFEAFSARARVAGVLTPPVLLGRLVAFGQTYRFDTWRNLRSGETRHTPTSWRFQMSGPEGSLTAEVVGRREDTAGLTYSNPDGQPTQCLNSKLAELKLTLTPHTGASRMLHSHKAALEVGQLDPGHGIKMLL